MAQSIRQWKYAYGGTPTAFDSDVLAGSAIIIFWSANIPHSSSPGTVPTDTLSSTYKLRTSWGAGSWNTDAECWVAYNVAAGSCTVTPPSATDYGFYMLEITGCASNGDPVVWTTWLNGGDSITDVNVPVHLAGTASIYAYWASERLDLFTSFNGGLTTLNHGTGHVDAVGYAHGNAAGDYTVGAHLSGIDDSAQQVVLVIALADAGGLGTSTITKTQHKSIYDGSTHALTLDSAVEADDVILVWTSGNGLPGHSGSPQVGDSCTDDLGHTYTLIENPVCISEGGTSGALWYTKVVTPGTPTITVPAAVDVGFHVSVWRGCDPANPIDVHNSFAEQPGTTPAWPVGADPKETDLVSVAGQTLVIAWANEETFGEYGFSVPRGTMVEIDQQAGHNSAWAYWPNCPTGTVRPGCRFDTSTGLPAGRSLVAAVTLNNAPVANGLLDDLIAYYKLDAANVFEDSYSDHTLTDQGTGVGTTTGKINEAATFNGTDQLLSTGDSPELRPSTKFTLSFWVYQSTSGARSLISKWGTGSDRVFLVRMNLISAGDVICYLDGAAGYGYTGAGVISANTWAYVVVVYDGTATGNSNRLKIYVDGVLQTLTFDSSTVPASLPAGTADLVFSKLDFPFNGRLDEVAYIVGKAWDAADVTTAYNGGSYLTFDNWDATVPPAVPSLTYYNSPYIFGENLLIRTIVPRNTGGPPSACVFDGSGDPSVPGLTLASNGQISGTPTTPGTYNLVVAPSNAGGSGSLASVQVIVRSGDMLGNISWGPNQRFRASALGLADGQDVTTWADDFGGNALTGLSAHKPTYKFGAVANLKAVQFDATLPSEMTLAMDWTNVKKGLTVFVVARNTKIDTTELLTFSAMLTNDDDSFMIAKDGKNTPWCDIFGKGTGNTSELFVADNDYMSANLISYCKTDGKQRLAMGAFTTHIAAAYGDISSTDTTLYLGGTTHTFGSPFTGYIFDIVIYQAELSDTDVANVKAALESLYGLDICQGIVLDGDSITNNTSRPSWPGYLGQNLTAANTTHQRWGPIANLSVGGTGLVHCNAVLPTAFGYIHSARGGTAYLCSTGTNDIAGGTTDAATWSAAYKQLLQDARSGGFSRIVAATILPRTTSVWDVAGFEALRSAINDIIRGWAGDGTYDALADFGGDAVMGAATAPNDTSLYLEGVHPTFHGATLLSPIAAAALDSLTWGGGGGGDVGESSSIRQTLLLKSSIRTGMIRSGMIR